MGEEMTEDSEEEEPVSTANLNARLLTHEKLNDFDNDGVLIFGDVETARDVAVIVNRVTDNFNSVTGIRNYDEGFMMVYYDRY